ncbi:hypothetical protein DQ384_38100 [Sphaerisporangium album]|uniref:Uncharacterized protein n=1 Tax=Sphaerisporangium album TaxID=509200 RepID=A0A367ENC5_9ACTN|nr:7-cyano-7-deazaguanine synthase [Sphaerisporangium album]RCG19095.1 hypothetical protein DQ384_38100 [Sphaerisporangium album]
MDQVQSCARCPNTTRNPTVRILPSGLCAICHWWAESPHASIRRRELQHVRALAGGGRGEVDALVGLSGGKDSTATLVRVLKMGFTPVAITFDTGYYPAHITQRAARVAAQLGVRHEVVDLRPHIQPEDRASYVLTAELYDREETPLLAERFRELYLLGRERYSVKQREPMAYVRTCQLCRRLVVPAYHREAARHGARVFFLGTNEWVGLSQNPGNGRYTFSAVRRLQPPGAHEPVLVVHLPFLLGAGLEDTVSVLREVGWEPPAGERVVESSANSCLLGRVAEAKAARLLGFHPDTVRLAREVTCGFLPREEAERALAAPHEATGSVRQVLTGAGILS